MSREAEEREKDAAVSNLLWSVRLHFNAALVNLPCVSSTNVSARSEVTRHCMTCGCWHRNENFNFTLKLLYICSDLIVSAGSWQLATSGVCVLRNSFVSGKPIAHFTKNANDALNKVQSIPANKSVDLPHFPNLTLLGTKHLSGRLCVPPSSCPVHQRGNHQR